MNAIAMQQSGAENLAENPIENALKRLKAIDESSGDYMDMYLQLFYEYEDAYRDQPELVQHIYKTLDATKNEIILYLDKIPEDQRQELTSIFDDLFAALADRPVLLCSVEFLRKFCSMASSPKLKTVVKDDEEPRKYRVPNVQIKEADHQRLYRELGFEPVQRGIGGDHPKWKDPKTGHSYGVSGSTSLTTKIVAKQLVENKVPLERIKAAFAKINIDFTIL